MHYAVENGVARVTLDSPRNRNALSGRLMGQLSACLDTAFGDDDVRVVVLGHTGSVFCSGMDLREASGADAAEQRVHVFPGILQSIWDSATPVIAAVGGPARAGGIGLLAVCDIVIASTAATFALSEVRLGLIPALISVPLLRRVSSTVLVELALTGETIEADRAEKIGLVNRAVGPRKLAAEVDYYVDMLVAGGPVALGAVKSLFRLPREGTMAEQYVAMQELSASFFASEEGQEGIASFAQKRPARWIPGQT